MKRILGGFAVVLLLLSALPAAAQSILLLNQQCGSPTPSVAFFPTALQNRGLAATITLNDAAFRTALTGGGPWDLIIVDEYSSGLSAATLTAIQNYIAGGGRAYMNHWAWDAATATSFGVTLGASYTTPITIYRWVPANPLFTTPNVLNTLIPTLDTCNVDGFFFTGNGGATEIGGYTAGATAGQAAVIVGNGGRTVLFGGIIGLFNGDNNGNGRPDGLELAENVLWYFFGAPTLIPVASTVGLALLALALVAGGAVALRRL